MMQKVSAASIILLIILSTTKGQDSEILKDSVSVEKLTYIGIGSMAVFGLSYGIQDNVWWKGQKSGFHFNWTQDWNKNRGSDKFGHLYFSYLLSSIYFELFNWAGVSEENSLLYSAGAAMFHQSFTEVRDGFSRDYGFSWGDYTFNIIGAFYSYLKFKNDFFRAIEFKISYFPSNRFNSGSNRYIFEDYESTYNWVSIDINQWLPESIEKYYPDFINLALGHTVRNIDYIGRSEFYLALDWNFDALPKTGFINVLNKLFGKYHLPSPAVKIYPNIVWYGIKF